LGELDSQQRDMQMLKDLHQETLRAERIQLPTYLHGVERIVHFLAVCVSEFIFKHESNIEGLNNIVVPYFGIEVVESGFRNLKPINLD
jgi:hypothetical protein